MLIVADLVSLRITNQKQQNLIGIFCLRSIQMCMLARKTIHLEFTWGSGGNPPPPKEAEDFFNQTKWRLFLYLFLFYFLLF